ncbi:MAG TPA: tRNA 2-thiouridine(34) synthase MnmA [Steroidobacteraceae bacterium]|jgi:tRNA-specific 2-thiouridylase|nr:tRNA 2-thiouridine(34) synthase MnmA [Steroidobacteraceae bacterium]
MSDSRLAGRLPSIPSAASTVIVGISGGVDSAVAALLLTRAGHSVQGLFMSNWEDDDDAYCTTAADFQDARRVCDVLGIPLHRVSFAAEYRARVFELFLREYAAGRTPNPDVLCNREIKFGLCLDYMRRLGADKVATGHYARIAEGPAGPELLKALDIAKDQSYFLHAVPARALGATLFPIGEMRKAEVRKLAHAAGLAVFDKPDSTGICFIGERPFQEFLSKHLRTEPGPIQDDRGRVIGEHRGLALYTLGQRSGLGIGGRADTAQAPWYVADKDIARNTLIVVQQQDHPLLLSDTLEVGEMSWLSEPPAVGESMRCGVKTRYRQADLDCTVQPLPGQAGAPWRITLDAPARAVTPGQYAVLYRGTRCLGGGVIARRSRADRASVAAAIGL